MNNDYVYRFKLLYPNVVEKINICINYVINTNKSKYGNITNIDIDKIKLKQLAQKYFINYTEQFIDDRLKMIIYLCMMDNEIYEILQNKYKFEFINIIKVLYFDAISNSLKHNSIDSVNSAESIYNESIYENKLFAKNKQLFKEHIDSGTTKVFIPREQIKYISPPSTGFSWGDSDNCAIQPSESFEEYIPGFEFNDRQSHGILGTSPIQSSFFGNFETGSSGFANYSGNSRFNEFIFPIDDVNC